MIPHELKNVIYTKQDLFSDFEFLSNLSSSTNFLPIENKKEITRNQI